MSRPCLLRLTNHNGSDPYSTMVMVMVMAGAIVVMVVMMMVVMIVLDGHNFWNRRLG
jgi:hypothetical protein